MPVAALAQGSPFDTGFNAIQSPFTGTIAKVASLVAIVIGGYGFAHGEPGAKNLSALGTKTPSHRLPEPFRRSVDQLNLASACFSFTVCEKPDIGLNTGVIKKVCR
jgi:hypothetical protein